MKASGRVKHINEPRRGFVLACFRVIYSCFAGQTEALECVPSILPRSLLLFLSVNNHLEQGHFDLLPQ